MKFVGPVLALVVALLSSRALAHDAAQGLDAPRAPQTTAPQARTRFSVGGGVGFANDTLGGDGLSGLVGLGFYRARTSVPYGTALLELKLSEPLRLGVGFSGGYSKATSRGVDQAALGSSLPGSSGWVGGTLSLRWVLNPADPVQVSPLLSLGAGYGTAKDVDGTFVPATATEPGHYLEADSTGKSVDARVGLVIEYRLLPQLFLRLESHFARVSYTKSELRDKPEGAGHHERVSQTALNVGWLPAVQLRVEF